MWWGATVKDIKYTQDGRTIYRLLYDAYPDGGFDEAEERNVEMGNVPDQIIELDDQLLQMDPQTYRMEPPGERGVVPCADDEDSGGYAGHYPGYGAAHMNQWQTYQQQLLQHQAQAQQALEAQMRQQQAHGGHAGGSNPAAMQQMLFHMQLQQQQQQRQQQSQAPQAQYGHYH